jgi:hypothetical protein
VVGIIGLDPTDAAVGLSSFDTGWTCGSATASIVQNAFGQTALTVVAMPPSTASNQTAVGYVLIPKVVNNNFANRTPIIGTLATMTGTNVGATKESGEPNIVGNSGGKSVWWTWTAPASGTVQIDTIGSTFDTIMGVYTGSSVSALTLVASDDDSGGNLTSKVTFNAVGGTTYQIAVDGYNYGSGAVSGSITLHVNLTVAATPQPPSNVATSYVVDAVHVTWTASANASAYAVYRSTSNNPATATRINSSDATGSSYNDTTAVAGTTYWYWVKARNNSGTLSDFSASASAVGGFQCTGYVAQVEGFPNNYPNAYQWGVSYVRAGVSQVPYLQQEGFTQALQPTPGAVIVFQPTAGHGVDTTNGHVGVVHAVQPIQSSTGAITGWNVTVRGANQGGTTFTDGGCPNVSDIVFSIGNSETLISYWTRTTS